MKIKLSLLFPPVMIIMLMFIFAACSRNEEPASTGAATTYAKETSNMDQIILEGTPAPGPDANATPEPAAAEAPQPSAASVGETAGANGNDTGSFYISTSGDDGNPGTLEKPFRTLDAARDAVRDYLDRTPELTKDIYVYIRGGTYITPYTFMLSSLDSGRDGKKIIYSGYKEEQVYISAGMLLDQWEKADGFSGIDNVYKTTLPEGFNDIYCLYEDNKRAYPARHPNVINGKNQYLTLADRTSAASLQARVNKKDLPDGADYTYAQMVLWPGSHNNGEMQFNWYSSVNPISRYNSTAGAFQLSLGTWWDMTIGNRYYIQNVKKFLDNKGEFFYDRSTRELYYKPYGDIKKAQILAPARVNAIFLSGDSPDDPVQNIVLTKLKIANSNFGESFSSQSDALRYEGMIKLENTRNITIENCHIFNSGYNGIAMWGYNSSNRVANCLIEDCGIGGVYIGMEYEQLPYKLAKPSDGQISKENTVSNNIIRNVGQCSPGHGYGVFLHQSGYNKVTHNTFYNIPKGAINLYNKQTGYLAGMSVGGVKITDSNQENYKYCRGNEIAFNEIFDVMKDGADCGAIITYGLGHGNVIDSNFIHDTTGLKDGINMGIYLDDNSDGVTITNNIVARIGGADWVNGAMLKGREITLKNNIFYNTRSNYGVIATMITRVAAWGMPQERTHDLTSSNNIVYEDKKINALYYHFGFDYQHTTIKEQNNNLYFIPGNSSGSSNGATVGYSIFNDAGTDQWEMVNFSKHQQNNGMKVDAKVLWSDPLFTDPDNNDFTLRQNSPALDLGFKPINTAQVGVDFSRYPFASAAKQAKEASKIKNNN